MQILVARPVQASFHVPPSFLFSLETFPIVPVGALDFPAELAFFEACILATGGQSKG